MGLFSRRDKPSRPEQLPKPLNSSYSNSSVHSSGSHSFANGNRTSAGSGSNGFGASVGFSPMSPLSPKSPIALPKTDLPRPPDPSLDPAGYLRSLVAVRERSRIIYDCAMRNNLTHFDVDFDKMSDVVSFVTRLIRVRIVSHAYSLVQPPNAG